MATLALKNVAKTYTDKVILENISVDIEDGEFIVIVGPSGCGKSTLLRLIAGLETLTAGDVYINDKFVNRLEAKDRDIAMVFQHYALYPHMSVYKNMAYGLRMRGTPKQEIARRVSRAAEILGLGNLLDCKPAQLSGGQRQRVAMGRAIVREPAIFLFDEPLSNLDAKLRVQMRLEIRKLQRNLGVTSVYVTHDQVEAMTLADRLIVLNGGKIEQIGAPLEVYRHPNSVFVAGFLGSPAMNFLNARLNNNGQEITIANTVNLPLMQALPEHANKEIILGIRPEHIFHQGKEGADWFDLHIDMIETLGADTLVYGRLPESEQNLTARLPGKWQARPGEKVSLAVMPQSLHLFDAQSELRL